MKYYLIVVSTSYQKAVESGSAAPPVSQPNCMYRMLEGDKVTVPPQNTRISLGRKIPGLFEVRMIATDLGGEWTKICVRAAPSVLSALLEQEEGWDVHDIPLDNESLVQVRG